VPSAAQSTGREVRRPATARRRRALLLDLPIAWRLGLGFLLAALVAAAATGVSSLQRTQALSNQSAFYESLLGTNTSLTTGDSFLQLMNTKVHDTLTDASAPSPSKETLANDQTAVSGLTDRYDTILAGYQQSDLIDQHPEQVAILAEAGRSIQVTQQHTFFQSAARTWQVYKTAQERVLQDVAIGDIANAQVLTRAQAEPTNADAQSALRALIQFDSRIASTIHDAAVVEQQAQLVTALIAALLAFLAVAFIGWVISNTLVRRLRELQLVSLAVEQGQVATRVAVAGRDEIATVSHAFNGMLDTIVGLLDVTSRQRDALTSAAERLYSDVRVAGVGDLRVNAAVSSDPIGMLANAFNFTVARFRRFVLRTHTTVDQLDVVTRQQYERVEAFHVRLTQIARDMSSAPATTAVVWPSQPSMVSDSPGLDASAAGEQALAQIGTMRRLVLQIAREGAGSHARAVLDVAEQAYLSAGRVSQLAVASLQEPLPGVRNAQASALMDELRTLGMLLTRLGTEANAFLGSSSTLLADLDGRLAQMAASEPPRPGPSFVSTAAAAAATGPRPAGFAAAAQVADLARLADVFAREVATLTHQLSTITQELRTGLSPFRLSPQDQRDAALYAPGTGYDELPDASGFDASAGYPSSQGRPLSAPRFSPMHAQSYPTTPSEI
jgi:methyl-accepting chemotaxis protein